jgi:hypothetical protein
LKYDEDILSMDSDLSLSRHFCRELELAPFSFLRGCQGFTGPFPLPFLISKIKDWRKSITAYWYQANLICYESVGKAGELAHKPMKFANFTEQELLNANGKQPGKITSGQDFYEVISK